MKKAESLAIDSVAMQRFGGKDGGLPARIALKAKSA